jgi:hypothetical protein
MSTRWKDIEQIYNFRYNHVFKLGSYSLLDRRQSDSVFRSRTTKQRI